VQRPVFYAIAIIITAYLPHLHAAGVEGKFFKPMAWTVAFALLGALIFSMLIAPALSSVVLPKGAKGMAKPDDDVSDQPHTAGVRWAIRNRWVLRSAAPACASDSDCRASPRDERRDRIGISPASG
jgi:cobalt-zinc-cadmium resistance protein CzcA